MVRPRLNPISDTIPAYFGGKLLWTGLGMLGRVQIGTSLPMQDPEERAAVAHAFMMSLFSSIFTDDILRIKCPDRY